MMSGGDLTDYKHNLYDLMMWANKVEGENPLLAEQMRDLYRLLDRYDYYLSADIGKEDMQKAWSEYREKWMACDTDMVKAFLMKECEALVDSVVKGWRRWGRMPQSSSRCRPRTAGRPSER